MTNHELTQALPVQALDPQNLQAQMDAETMRRQVIKTFIGKNLQEGTDWGVIHLGGRDSKPCLFKPGAEKFCSLLQLRAEFSKDEETLSMLGATEGIVAYLCRLIHIPSGNVLSEGRGACALKEKQGLVNTVIKIAEKRAQIDAVLRLGLSDSFTQDLEDLEPPRPTEKISDQDQKKLSIAELVHNMGFEPKTPEEWKATVKAITDLDLEPANFDRIVTKLQAVQKPPQNV